jgi:hypothetical protein
MLLCLGPGIARHIRGALLWADADEIAFLFWQISSEDKIS